MLQPPPGVQERILVMGGFGAGKTTCWLSIAKWSKETGSDAKFYVLDTDSSVRHMMSVPGSQYAGLDNVIVFDVFDWPEYVGTLNNVIADVRPGLDWIVVDFVSAAWDAVQEYYVDMVYKTNFAEFFLEQAMAKQTKAPLDGWKDWSVINKMYKEWSNTLIQRSNGAHIFMVAGSKAIGDSDDRSVRSMFGAHGVRPTGQKHLGHLPHSVLLNLAPRPGEIFVTTVKDRERPVLEAAPVNDFALDYLVTVAGWKLM